MQPEYGAIASAFLRLINPDSGKLGLFQGNSSWTAYPHHQTESYAPKIDRHLDEGWPYLKWPGT